MRNLITLSLLFIVFASCKKSASPNPQADNTMHVQITSNVNFDYGISEWDPVSEKMTIDISGNNVADVDYSFVPVPGQNIEIGGSTSIVSNLTLKVTYKGQVYGPTTSANGGSSVFDFKFEVPKN